MWQYFIPSAIFIGFVISVSLTAHFTARAVNRSNEVEELFHYLMHLCSILVPLSFILEIAQVHLFSHTHSSEYLSIIVIICGFGQLIYSFISNRGRFRIPIMLSLFFAVLGYLIINAVRNAF